MSDSVLAPLKQPLFVKEEVNTSRQIQFDIAKVVCLIGMVFVHCFEELGVNEVSDGSVAQYITVVVLDCLFGAGTFMVCMGLGIAYSWKQNAAKLMNRGLLLVGIAYLLNTFRIVIPYFGLTLLGHDVWTDIAVGFFDLDILQFAGLALFLFGLLKRFKVSDLAMFIIALVMSIAGSFVFCWDAGSLVANELLGLFVGTKSVENDEIMACFPLLNWFIVVVFGYIYGKYIRRCTNINKFYAIAFPVSTAILAVYMGIAIPNKMGMMSGNLDYFYQMNTLSAAVVLSGAVFASGLYHFISKIIPALIKKFLTRLSSNINSFYCIHWVMIGWIEAALIYLGTGKMEDDQILITSLIVLLSAGFLSDFFRHKLKKNKRKSLHAEESQALPAESEKALTMDAADNITTEDKKEVVHN